MSRSTCRAASSSSELPEAKCVTQVKTTKRYTLEISKAQLIEMIRQTLNIRVDSEVVIHHPDSDDYPDSSLVLQWDIVSEKLIDE